MGANALRDVAGISWRSATGLPFLDHMLDQLGTHGLLDLDVKVRNHLPISSAAERPTHECVGCAMMLAVAEARGCAGLRGSTLTHARARIERGGEQGVTVTQVSGRTDAMDDETVNNTVGAAVGAAISELQLSSPVRLS
jgi:hypothetical protein